MDRAVLRGADFTSANLPSANLIGAILEEARFYCVPLDGTAWTE
jgi:uncharacterized protein YjbI with pentapeptide repeats